MKKLIKNMLAGLVLMGITLTHGGNYPLNNANDYRNIILNARECKYYRPGTMTYVTATEEWNKLGKPQRKKDLIKALKATRVNGKKNTGMHDDLIRCIKTKS